MISSISNVERKQIVEYTHSTPILDVFKFSDGFLLTDKNADMHLLSSSGKMIGLIHCRKYGVKMALELHNKLLVMSDITEDRLKVLKNENKVDKVCYALRTINVIISKKMSYTYDKLYYGPEIPLIHMSVYKDNIVATDGQTVYFWDVGNDKCKIQLKFPCLFVNMTDYYREKLAIVTLSIYKGNTMVDIHDLEAASQKPIVSKLLLYSGTNIMNMRVFKDFLHVMTDDKLFTIDTYKMNVKFNHLEHKPFSDVFYPKLAVKKNTSCMDMDNEVVVAVNEQGCLWIQSEFHHLKRFKIFEFSINLVSISSEKHTICCINESTVKLLTY